MASEEPRWLLLMHQIPPEPAYLRVRIGRRLQGLGAVALRNAVYALPRSDATQEDFAWVLREIVEEGGEAVIVAAALIEGLRDEDVERLFHAARSADYGKLAERAAKLEAALARGDLTPAKAAAELRRIEGQLASTIAIDFFDAPERRVAEQGIESAAVRVRAAERPEKSKEPSATQFDLAPFIGRTWVTRRGIHVDRMASAWLIRERIDPSAHFKFVSARGYQAEPDELRFDMYEAEYTHDGELCTFEVLLREFELDEPALHAIGDIVRAIDLKLEEPTRPETVGVAHAVEGIARRYDEDEARLCDGAALFGALYAYFRTKEKRR